MTARFECADVERSTGECEGARARVPELERAGDRQGAAGLVEFSGSLGGRRGAAEVNVGRGSSARAQRVRSAAADVEPGPDASGGDGSAGLGEGSIAGGRADLD